MTTTPTPSDAREELKIALKHDFNALYVKGFTTSWEAERLVRGIEIDVMGLDNLEALLAEKVREARIDENKTWQKLVLDRQEIHSSSPYINVLEYEQRIEQLKDISPPERSK